MATDARTPRRYQLVALANVLVGTLWFAFYHFTGRTDWIGFVFMPAGGVAGSVAVVRLLRNVALEPAARRFWRLMLAAALLFTLGYGYLAVAMFQVRPLLPPTPIPVAATVGAGFLVLMAAVIGVPLGVMDGPERRRQLLDRTIAFLGCATPLWSFGLAPMLTARERWSDQAIAMIVMSLILAVASATKVAYVTAGPIDRVAVRLVAGMSWTGAIVAILSLHGDGGMLLAQGVVMPMAPLLLTYAVGRQWWRPPHGPARANSWLPYLAIAAVDLPLIAIIPAGLTWPGRVAIGAAVVVSALVAVRQFAGFQENARLLREKRDSQELLQHQVTHDGLTGLANRGLFRTLLAEELAAGETTVLLVDLDDFKTVNDSLGHEVGDHLLIAVAGALNGAVGGDGLAVRLGGDEFAVLLFPDAPDGEEVAENILRGFGGPLSVHELLVHASIGIATAAAGSSLDHLLRDADTAMYAAKQRGKANWVRHQPGLDQPVFAHARLGGELRRALDAGEFRVVYQPIIDLATNVIVGAEPLVRWLHPTRGMISPAEFIPAAEGTGLIVPLGRFVLRETCRQAAAWLAEFGPDALDKVGPNVSVRQLHDPDFVGDVRAAMADFGLPADRLVLELTESAVLRGPQVLRTLHELHGMGVRLALDDFGTGESSLSLLRAFPASIVKLDKSFVDGIELDEPGTPAADARQAVARAVAQLAAAFGLTTIAEGIESQEQADRLLLLGYRLGQGYHLARPGDPEQVTRLLAASRDLAAAA